MLSRTTRSSSCSRRPICSTSLSATSFGARIVHRPDGQSAISRRPSSKAAASCAALTSPTPEMASSSMPVARARPVSPSYRPSASSASSKALMPREPEPHSSAMSSAEVSPAAPRRARRSRGRSLTGSSRIARLPVRCWSTIARGRLGVATGSTIDRLSPVPAAGARRPQNPDDGSPPIPPAIRIQGTKRL